MVHILIASILSFSAVFFWGIFYFYYSPRLTTPRGTLFILFLGGILAAIIAFFVEREIFSILPPSLNPFFSGQAIVSNLRELLSICILFFIFFVPLEELAKFLILRFVINRRPKELNQVIDGLKFGIAVGLGFAFLENAVYFKVYLGSLEKADFARLFFLRFFTATLAHSLYGGFMGYFLGLAKFYRLYSGKFIRWGILGAIVFHSLYNIFLFTSVSFLSIILLIILLMIIMKWYSDRRYLEVKIQKGQIGQISPPFLGSRPEFESILSKNKVSYNFIKKLNLCPFCLKDISSKDDTCSYCGKKLKRK